MKIRLKDIIHLYLGCEVKVSNPAYINGGYTGELTGISETEGFFINNNVLAKGWEEPETCKLILRNLSDMTDKERISFHKLYRRGLPGDGHLIEPKLDRLTPVQMKYLLNIGIDLFDLIKNKEAIDKTTNK
jgi:hypothetical protein